MLMMILSLTGVSAIDLTQCHSGLSGENTINNKGSNVAIDLQLPDASSTLVSSQLRGCKESLSTGLASHHLDNNGSLTQSSGLENNNKTDIQHNLNNNSMEKSTSDDTTARDSQQEQQSTSTTTTVVTSAAVSPVSEPKLETSEPKETSASGGAVPKMTQSKKTVSRGRFASHSAGDHNRHAMHQHRSSTGTVGAGIGSRQPDFPLRMVVNTDMVGAIIGKSGGTIKDITRESKARVDVLRKDNSGAVDKVICIFGSPDHCSKACLKIMQVVQQEALHLEKNPSDFPLRILAHNSLIGRIIGKSGATIKKIMETTETRITVSANIFDSSNMTLPERVITITGNSIEAACAAEEQISSKLRSCYENEYALASMIPPVMPGFPPTVHSGMHGMLPPHQQSGREGRSGHPSFGGPFYGHLNAAAALLHNPSAFAAFGSHHHSHHPGPLSPSSIGPPLHDTTKVSVNIYVPAYAVGGIIGPKGTTIREIIQMTGANVKVPQLKGPQTGDVYPGSGERKVTVVGSQEAQWRAQFHIFKRVLVDSVSPNIPIESTLRVEMMVPSSQVGRIIGKNGQTVRELQRLTHAQIKLPEPSEEGSSTASTSPDAETPVSITGDFYSAWVSHACFAISFKTSHFHSSQQSAQRQIRALVMRGQTPGSMEFPHHYHQPHVSPVTSRASVKSSLKARDKQKDQRKKSPEAPASPSKEDSETKDTLSDDSTRQESSPSTDPSISSSPSVDKELPPPLESSGDHEKDSS